jgi:hypothetical protein
LQGHRVRKQSSGSHQISFGIKLELNYSAADSTPASGMLRPS